MGVCTEDRVGCRCMEERMAGQREGKMNGWMSGWMG